MSNVVEGAKYIIATVCFVPALMIFSLLGVMFRNRSMIAIGKDREDTFHLTLLDERRAKLIRSR